MRTIPLALLAICCLAAASDPQAAPCKEPAGAAPIPNIELQEIADGFRMPAHIGSIGDGSGKLFIVEQQGIVRVMEHGRVLPQAFLDIRDRVESGGEKGLLSIVFDPKYKENGFFYVDYTTRADKLYTHVSRFKRLSPYRGDKRSETVLLKIEQPYPNHNGGQLAFGPDGYLYIGMGDGGSANDPHGHGQNLASLLGKILRIDVNREQPPLRYAIPSDNPLVHKPNARAEIWAYGLRNPWRFSFDAGNGRLYLADVGQNHKEEIDVITKGGNYGWNIMEGDICTPAVNDRCDKAGLDLPILTYAHTFGRSVTGGFVYRGQGIPGLCGVYLYADYVSGRIWGLRYDGKRVVAQRELMKTSHSISSFGQDDGLELYIADHQDGKIFKIVPKK